MNELGEKIIELRLATRRACMCENADNKKSTLSLKTKVLYLISKKCSPKELTLKLCIAKTNLALITSGLIKEGFLIKTKGGRDKREVSFSLTKAGERHLSDCISIIEGNFKNILTSKKEYDKALVSLEEVLDLFSFLSY